MIQRFTFFFLVFGAALYAEIPDRLPRVLVHYVQQQQGDISVLHTLFAVDGSTLKPRSIGERQFQGGVLIELQFKQEDSLVFQDAFRMLSPMVGDSSLINGTYLAQNRYALNDGDYQLILRVRDLAHPENIQELTTEVDIHTEKKALIISEPLFFTIPSSDMMEPTDEMEPLVPSGDYLFPESARNLRFYAEIYNLDQHADSRSLLKYYLTDLEGNIKGQYSGFKRIDPQSSIPLSSGFDLAELPRGLYFLNIEIIDQEGQQMALSRTLFYRQSAAESALTAGEEAMLARQNWLPPLEEVDSLTYLLDVLHPLGDALERVTIDNLLDNGTPVQKKRFIAAFWEKYYPLNTQAAYEDYMKVVQQMNRKYGTRALRGYRTDRGRVYLQYGAPDLVEERKYEPSMYPYEIWQYNRLNSNSSTPQVNRVFIFANLASGGDQYDVIHSNAEGEFFNDRWSIQLNRRVLPQMDIDENGSDVIQHGGRSNNNLIINGGSIDRVNRR